MLKLALFAVMVAVGQLMFKRVAQGVAGVEGLPSLIQRILPDPWFLGAMCLYLLATLLWILALRDIALSRAYPFTALSYALVPVGAALLYGETLDLRYLIGLALVLAGIYVLGTSGSPIADHPQMARTHVE